MWNSAEALQNTTQEDKEDNYYINYDFFINVIKFGVNPKNLDDRKYKAPIIQKRKEFKVAFGTNKGFELTADPKLVVKISEAFLHNDNKRCTILFRGLGSFTFQLKEAKFLKYSAKYDLKIRNKWISCNLQFDITRDQVPNGKKPGFKIRGSGEDNGKEFTLKSDTFHFDKDFLEDWSLLVVTKDGDFADF